MEAASEMHVYLSTGCYHGHHQHCCNSVNLQGQPKVPGKCKFCESRCICPCHREPELHDPV